MCTAVSFTGENGYFGRTLDWFCSFGEKIVITPRNMAVKLRNGGELSRHYAIIGTAKSVSGFPLYFDAANECGLCAAGLNFPNNAKYASPSGGSKDITSFELIPYILGQCDSVKEARKILNKIRITDASFSAELPPSPLHWMLSDREENIVVEVRDGETKVFDNPAGVLTNNPPFEYQLWNLNNYISLSSKPPLNNFSNAIDLCPYSYGMGAIGLPGDFSSVSRFVRAAFLRGNVDGDTENEYKTVFRILDSVSQPKGCTLVDGQIEYTVYSSCIDGGRGIYYYKTYGGGICAVNMNKEDLSLNHLIEFDFCDSENTFFQN